MNKPASLFLGLFLFGVSRLHAVDPWAQWALETDVGGATALASQTVREEGKSGLSAGVMVRLSRDEIWDTGFGYNVLSLQNNRRLRPATMVADRRFSPWGAWAPYLRLGAGLSTDQSRGSLNRLVGRGGIGLRRPINGRWEVGIKSEVWYSPRAGETGNDMLFLTAGLTLSRSFARAVKPKIVIEPDPVKQPTPEPVEEVTKSVPAQKVELPKPVRILTEPPKPLHILFRTEGWKIDKSDAEAKEKALQAMAQFLFAFPTVPAEIHGHSDSKGPAGYNMALSRRRAEALRDLFVTRWGLPSNRFAIFAHGSKKPVASNGTPLGRAKNRRAVVIVLSEWLP
jgi:outer membrane protein OmpA-like peptidoglycan-associated protein